MNNDTTIEPAVAGASTVIFDADGAASAGTDCNTFRGTYTEGEGSQLTIDLPISTRMACPPESQEEKYIQDLTGIQSYLFQDGNLYLMLPFDSGTMEFAPAQ